MGGGGGEQALTMCGHKSHGFSDAMVDRRKFGLKEILAQLV